jgi:hypothetical protein
LLISIASWDNYMNPDAFLYVVQLKDHSKSAHSEPIKTS